MIELYYWPTPNGHKITIMLEECGLDYKIYPINIGAGDQFKPEFLAISPNNRIPAIRDLDPLDGGSPMELFESGAILLYLAEKTGRFMPVELRSRYEVIKWLMWQMGGLGPMAGQNHHFNRFAPESIVYAQERYIKETSRLYGVLNKNLANKEYVAGSYSVADMAIYPWVFPYEMQQQNLNDFTYVKTWFERMANRPAVQNAYTKSNEVMV